jgi:hypothetical protein
MSEQRVSDAVVLDWSRIDPNGPVDGVSTSAAVSLALDLLDAHRELEEKDREIERLMEMNSVCICGCPISEHENYGEDGEACDNPDHECLRTCPAIVAMFAKERTARKQAERERDEARKALLWFWTHSDDEVEPDWVSNAARAAEEAHDE